VLVMADNKIMREDAIGSPLEEYLKIWQHSGPGQGCWRLIHLTWNTWCSRKANYVQSRFY